MPRNRGTLLGFMSFREFKGFSVELAGLTIHLKEAESFQAWEMFASGLLESTRLRGESQVWLPGDGLAGWLSRRALPPTRPHLKVL